MLIEWEISSTRCNGPHYLTCNNVKKCDTFTSHAPKKTCKKINYHFNCNSKCLIYLFSCKVCGKQYVGFTTDKFSYQWYNYKNCQHKAEKEEHHMQKQLPDQFLSEDHDGLLNNVEITPIDKTDPWKKREILED